jgi:hypothetical protein
MSGETAGATQRDPERGLSDRDFVALLRDTIDRYLTAVEQWEAAYQKYYRLPGYASQVSADMAAEEDEYCRRRRELQDMLPRARRLCLKHRVREPFSGLLRVELGRYAPQQRQDPAIGRGERNLVAEGLVELDVACRHWESNSTAAETDRDADPELGKLPLLRRLVNYFY